MVIDSYKFNACKVPTARTHIAKLMACAVVAWVYRYSTYVLEVRYGACRDVKPLCLHAQNPLILRSREFRTHAITA